MRHLIRITLPSPSVECSKWRLSDQPKCRSALFFFIPHSYLPFSPYSVPTCFSAFLFALSFILLINSLLFAFFLPSQRLLFHLLLERAKAIVLSTLYFRNEDLRKLYKTCQMAWYCPSSMVLPTSLYPYECLINKYSKLTPKCSNWAIARKWKGWEKAEAFEWG